MHLTARPASRCNHFLPLPLARADSCTCARRIVPLPIVRGLQLGLGTLLVRKGVMLLNTDPDWTQRFMGWDGHVLAGCCFIYALLFYRSRRVPVALVLFGFGLIVAIFRCAFHQTHTHTPPHHLPAQLDSRSIPAQGELR